MPRLAAAQMNSTVEARVAAARGPGAGGGATARLVRAGMCSFAITAKPSAHHRMLLQVRARRRALRLCPGSTTALLTEMEARHSAHWLAGYTCLCAKCLALPLVLDSCE